LYGPYALQVLEGYLTDLPRKKGGMRTYKIAKPLPTEDEVKERQKRKYTSTVADLVASAFAELEDLASEVGDWYDNLPEGLKSGDKGSALEDARGTLESLSQPDVPDAVGAREVYYLPLQGVRGGWHGGMTPLAACKPWLMLSILTRTMAT
jgi:hypothetical protein